jgi:hypothetical protein
MVKRKNDEPFDIFGYPQVGRPKHVPGKYVGPGEGTRKKVTPKPKPKKVLHVSQIKAKPKVIPKAKRNESFDMNPLGGAKPKVVAKPKPRKAKVQKSGYDPLAGQRIPAKNGKKSDAQRLKEWETEMRATWKRLYGPKK